MNKRTKLALLAALAFAALTLLACMTSLPSYAPGSQGTSSLFNISPLPTSMPPTGEIAIALPPTLALNQPISATATIVAAEDLPSGPMLISIDGPDGGRLFTVPLGIMHAQQATQVAVPLMFSQMGEYHVVMSVGHPAGGIAASGSVRLLFNQEGVVVNPTAFPGPAAAPASQGGGIVTPGPTAVPTVVVQPTPTAEASSQSDAISTLSKDARIQSPEECWDLISIYGTVRYDDRSDSGTPQRIPARYIKVQAWDNNSLGVPAGQSPDALLGETYADSNGFWRIDNVCNVDWDGTGTRRDLYLMFYTDTNPAAASERSVRWPNSTPYAWHTKDSRLYCLGYCQCFDAL